MRQRVHRLHRHHRAFERRRGVEHQREHHEFRRRVGAQLVPRAVEREQPVGRRAPARHQQHERERHADRLHPVGQRRIEQVVRSRPHVHGDQRPEVDDREAVAP